MLRDQILASLRAHETELKATGVTSIALFGSVARGDDRLDSDVDLTLKVDQTKLPTGFAYFGLISDLEQRLASILGRSVEPVRKPVLRRAIERDRTIAF